MRLTSESGNIYIYIYIYIEINIKRERERERNQSAEAVEYANCISLPMSVQGMTLNHLILRLQSGNFRDRGMLHHGHYFRVQSDRDL